MIIPITLITEDILSETVAKKMLKETNRNYDVVNNIPWGKDRIREKITGINNSADNHPYFVLTDQDTPDRCPPDAIKELPGPVHANLLYRFAVLEIESWLMAHREAMSNFLFIPINRIPENTDKISHPKECLIGLARKSKSAKIRQDIVPRNNSTSKVGPDYNGILGEFVSKHWDVQLASRHSPSLARTFLKLKNFNFTPTLRKP